MHLRFATTFTNYGKPTLNTQVSVGKFARSQSEVAIRGANKQYVLHSLQNAGAKIHNSFESTK